MRIGKKGIQSGILVVLMLVLALTAICQPVPAANNEIVVLKPGIAGIINATQFNKDNFPSVDIEISGSQQVTSPESSVEENEDEIFDEDFLNSSATQKVDPDWAYRLMVTVTDMALNVREGASTESKIVGKMFAGSAATVLGREGEWVKIQSGDVEGYVHSDYCVFGEDAKALAEQVGTYHAIAITDNLRVRSTPSTEGETLTKVDKDSSFKVAVDAEKVEGWVAIEYNGSVAYVAEEYVEVTLVVGKAITMEEYAEKIRKEQAEKEAAKKEQNKQHAAYLGATVDEITLLAAIIWCEAGNQCYEGMVAVGAVVMNRVRSNRFPNDIYSVIYQTGQFTPVVNGFLAYRLANASGIPQDCISAAKDALSGVDNVNGALFFNHVSTGKTGLIIGDHVFW